MPAEPKTPAKGIETLAKRAAELHALVWAACPERCRDLEAKPPRDQAGLWWRRSMLACHQLDAAMAGLDRAAGQQGPEQNGAAP